MAYNKAQIEALYNDIVLQSGIYVEFPSDPICQSFAYESTSSQCYRYTSDDYVTLSNDFRLSLIHI